MRNRRQFIKESALAGLGLSLGLPAAISGPYVKSDNDIRIGIIGLDTSHSPAFAKYINDPQKTSMKGVSVTAAYPYGSRNIKSSYERIPEYTQQFRDMGIKIVDSIGDLLKLTDCILLETNDGNPHYEQALEVMKAGKPMFIDKPVAANLVQVLKIIEANKKYKVPMFSSSSLRYLPQAQKIRNEHPIGDITGADAYSPEHLDPTHTDLYWYGIHGVEILYTLIGTGCQRLKRITTGNTDMVVGEWDGGRIGTFRGDLEARQHYGGIAYGTKGIMDTGNFEGYGLLVEEIVKFFKTRQSPVDINETLEIYTFMQAADTSKEMNGDWADLKSVYDKAYKEAMG